MRNSRTFSTIRLSRLTPTHRLLAALTTLTFLLSALSFILPVWAARADPSLSGNHTVTLIIDGQASVHPAGEETVTELLERLEVEVGTYDTLYPRGDALITEALTIRLERASVTYDTILEELPYGTLYQEDSALPAGTEQVLQEGKAGVHCSYYRNIVTPEGVTYRRLVRSGVKTHPVDEIILRGTGQAARETPPPAAEPSSTPENTPEISSNTITTAGGEVLTYSKVLTCTATAYTASPGALTATGTTPRVGAIAVDPKVIPYGTRMYILTSDGSIIYGHAVAEDCGGFIKGNRVDLYYNSYDECIQFGRREVTVYILE